MTSLFDIAAGLSQYEDDAKVGHIKLRAIHPQSALSILDETFETIHNSQKYRATKRHLPMLRSMTSMQLQSTRLAESKSSEALDARRYRLASFDSATTIPVRRMASAISASNLVVPPLPVVLPDSYRKPNNLDKDPDITAKDVLRDVTSEIEQLMTTDTRSIKDRESLLRMLTEKYTQATLDKLPGTPFVLLIRKKVAQKLEQFERHLCSRRNLDEQTAVQSMESKNNNSNRNVGSSSLSFDSLPTPQQLIPSQQVMLWNLLRLPEEQLLKLPKAQLKLVQFAKRYDKLIKTPPAQLRHLPIEQQHVVRSMQQQQLQLFRADERR